MQKHGAAVCGLHSGLPRSRLLDDLCVGPRLPRPRLNTDVFNSLTACRFDGIWRPCFDAATASAGVHHPRPRARDAYAA